MCSAISRCSWHTWQIWFSAFSSWHGWYFRAAWAVKNPAASPKYSLLKDNTIIVNLAILIVLVALQQTTSGIRFNTRLLWQASIPCWLGIHCRVRWILCPNCFKFHIPNLLNLYLPLCSIFCQSYTNQYWCR